MCSSAQRQVSTRISRNTRRSSCGAEKQNCRRYDCRNRSVRVKLTTLTTGTNYVRASPIRPCIDGRSTSQSIEVRSTSQRTQLTRSRSTRTTKIETSNWCVSSRSNAKYVEWSTLKIPTFSTRTVFAPLPFLRHGRHQPPLASTGRHGKSTAELALV